MRIVAVGQPDEVRGFALAGVETAPCRTAQEADRVLSTLVADDSQVGVIVVSAWANQAVAGSVARARERRDAPVVIVLPPTDEAESRGLAARDESR